MLLKKNEEMDYIPVDEDRCDHGCPAIAKQKCGSLWGDDGECLIRKKAFLKGILDHNTESEE